MFGRKKSKDPVYSHMDPETIDSNFDKLHAKIASLESSLSVLCEEKTQPKANLSYSLNIKLPAVEDTIVVNVSVFDNVVKIKRHISSQYPSLPDYKSMKLKYNETIFEDNAYLPPFLDFSKATLLYELSNKPAKDLLVLKLHGNRPLPDLLQVKTSLTVKEMKEIICKQFFIENVTLYKDLVELTDSTKLEKFKLHDDDIIESILRVTYQVKVNDIFDGFKCETIDIINTSKVDTLKEKIATKFNFDATNIILLMGDEYLCPDKFIFKYNLSTGSRITFLCIKKFTNINLLESAIATDHCSELFMANNKDKEVVLKRYDISRVTNLIQHWTLINELRRLQIFKSHPRFVTLLDVYKDDKYLYVEMEKLIGGSILDYVNQNKPVPENKIIKWSKHILDGLKYIHDKGIIYGDLKPSNILLDDELNVKLSGFDLSRYWAPFGVNDANLLITRRYMAPEVLGNLPYNASTDVWSFGATLLFLITGKPPNHSQDEDEAVFTICTTQSIQYDTSNVNLKVLLDKCLNGDPSERPSVDELILDKFINRVDN